MKHSFVVEKGKPGLDRAIQQMAAFLGVGVNFSMQMVIETDDDKMARIVETLVAAEPSEDKEEEELPKRLVIQPMRAGEPVLAPTGVAEGTPVYVEMVKMNGEPVNVPVEALKRAAKQTEMVAGIIQKAKERRKAEGNTCTYCGAPISAKAKMCGKAECKRKYNNEQYAKRKGKMAEAPAEEAVEGEAAEVTPDDPFGIAPEPTPTGVEWPTGTIWRVVDGNLAGKTYANWEISEALSDLELEPGTMVEHRLRGMWQVRQTLDGPRDKYTGGGQKLRLVQMPTRKESATEESEEAHREEHQRQADEL